MKKVPFLDLKRAYKIYGKEIEEAVAKVLRSGIYLNGEKTREIEEKLAEYLGVSYAIGVSSGTCGLYLILEALELPKNSYILLPSFTFVATAEVVIKAGLIPYFVDIEESTYNLSFEALKSAYKKLIKNGKKVSGIIVVSLFGIPADLEKIEIFCKENDLILIEDICQAFGAKIGNKKVGSFGSASATSFYPTKPLSTCGDAGMVFTNNKKLYYKIKALKEHGQTRPYFYEFNGTNGRIDEIHSAILCVKFKYFENELMLRKKWAKKYKEGLQELYPLIKHPQIPENYHSSFSLYTVRAEKRDELRKFLAENGINTGVYYSLPLHLQPIYQNLGFKKGDLPTTEKLSEEVISLPFYPYITEEEIDYTIEKIKEFYNKMN